MEHYHISENDLLDEEVLYEMNLRGIVGTGGPDDRRRLRNWFRREGNAEYACPKSMTDEYFHISTNLRELEANLLEGRALGARSRLIHYYRRIRRIEAANLQEQENQQVMLDIVRRMGSRYFQLDLNRLDQLLDDPLDEAEARENPVTQAGKMAQTERVDPRPSAFGGDVDPDEIRAQCLALAKQIIEQSLPQPQPRLSGRSLDSQLPPKRNLESELEAADRRGFSLEGTQMPLRSHAKVYGVVQKEGRREQLIPPEPLPRASATSFAPTIATMTSQATTQLIDSSGIPWSGRGGVPVLPSVTVARHGDPPSRRTLSPPLFSLRPNASQGTGFTPGLAAEGRPEMDRESDSSTLQNNRRDPPPTPTNANFDLTNYVHASEIKDYVNTYVRELLTQRPNRFLVRDTLVNNLATQIADIGLRDSDLSRISRGEPPRMGQPHEEQSMGQPQRLGISLEDRAVNREADIIYPPSAGFRESRRNSFPLLQTPHEQYFGNVPAEPPAGPSGNARRDGSSPFPSGFPPNYSGFAQRTRLPYQTCNIMEKWPKFSGDASPVPVVDFLRQLELLCRSYQISKDELRTHAHLLFKDDAAVWYTAYEPKFDSWDTLLYYLRMRYDNPNRDRFVKEEMRNRKQRPNELFSAFLTDMETLAQRLIRKISEQEKFEIIVENMKISYKRRLALEEIRSIEHLAQLCYRFDTLEAHLYNPKMPAKPHVVNEVYAEDSEDSSEEEVDESGEINMVDARKNRGGLRGKRTDFSETTDGLGRAKPLCWNCRKVGHLWRDCETKKMIFCHMCGHPDVTAFTCPQQHNLRAVPDNQSKNE